MVFIDRSGMVFGWIIALERAASKNRKTMYLCQCLRPGCGREVVVSACNLTSGHTQTCGCGHTKHGMSRTLAYKCWSGMMDRCYKKNHKYYHRYGGRGITVCERWHIFENFLEDMGQPPPGLTLDRIKNWLGYSKDNCRWATYKEQNRNKSDNRLVSVFGVMMTVTEAAEKTGIPRTAIYQRIYNGWSDHDATTIPVGKKRPKRQPGGSA